MRFDANALDLARKIEDRFDDYVAVLTGLRARFNTPEAVTRSDFRNYVAGLNLASAYPGFQAATYAPLVSADEKGAFEAQVRRDAEPRRRRGLHFAIKPPGERDIYYPLLYIEPQAGNEMLLGNDLGAMPDRGNALEQGRDTGGLVTSGRKVRIPGREADIGLAMRLPVYRPQAPLDTLEQRRRAYMGSVGTGLSIAGMLRDVVSPDRSRMLRLRPADAGPAAAIERASRSGFRTPTAFDEQQLLFDSAALVKLAVALATPGGQSLRRMLGFELGGHSWLVEVEQDESEVFGPLDKAIPWFVVLGGLATSTLLAAIVFSLTTSRSRAQVLATEMTSHLRVSERQCEGRPAPGQPGRLDLDPETGALECSEEARRILGFADDPPPPNLYALLSRAGLERAAVHQQITWACESTQRSEFEHRLRLPDGTERWLHVIAQSGEHGERSWCAARCAMPRGRARMRCGRSSNTRSPGCWPATAGPRR